LPDTLARGRGQGKGAAWNGLSFQRLLPAAFRKCIRNYGAHVACRDGSAAKLLIVAIPPSYHIRQILEQARAANPAIDTAVRTHRASDLAELKSLGVGLAIMGPREVALGLLGYALTNLGLAANRAEAVVKEARLSGEGGAFDRESEGESPEAAPELRERKDDDQEA
jgi:hypothetical protein